MKNQIYIAKALYDAGTYQIKVRNIRNELHLAAQLLFEINSILMHLQTISDAVKTESNTLSCHLSHLLPLYAQLSRQITAAMTISNK